MSAERVYLDHHAATPPIAAALEAMERARAAAWANPASVHREGRQARALLERARSQVAGAIGGQVSELILTAGGSEACNLGVLGLGGNESGEAERPDVLTTAVEHPAVLRAAERRAAAQGGRVVMLAVPEGRPPGEDEFEAALGPRVGLCALQWVNHETGTVFPVEAYARVCRQAGVPLVVDATQAAGKVGIDVGALGADALALASHKLGGPAGAGALWVSRRSVLQPQLLGGGQESGRRAGSPDVLSLVGFGAACAELAARLAGQRRLSQLRERVEGELIRLGGVVNGAAGPRVATVSNVSFRGQRGDELVAALDLEGVGASSGAACSSGLAEASPVLRAMYPDQAWRAGAALRLSFGPQTTENECKFALRLLQQVLLRGAAGKS
ncbi:MAG: aminotransferase class V-fold PLP-dependent enzyme [Myxococcales bacterium]|nr:aminotransferase class V-fold PLP-dependent enzyme [Myxococcales bacterium]